MDYRARLASQYAHALETGNLELGLAPRDAACSDFLLAAMLEAIDDDFVEREGIVVSEDELERSRARLKEMLAARGIHL